MDGINYTFIIPHRNIPHLLARCLASIPRRPDVQIIVVDDASDPTVVDFDRFPGLDDPQVEVVFTKEWRGAGCARNVGLERAVGKWVVFADADDYYLDNLSAMMDRYVDSDKDMLLFRIVLQPPSRKILWNDAYKPVFDRAVASGDCEEIKRVCPYPVARFIKRDLIGSIRFPEIAYAEDVMFSLRVSLASKATEVVDEVVYCYVQVPNSAMRTNKWQKSYTHTKVRLDVCRFFERRGDTKWKEYGLDRTWRNWWYSTWKRNRWAALRLLPLVAIRTGSVPLKDIFSPPPRNLCTAPPESIPLEVLKTGKIPRANT
ncbi:MAG: glycosyltransferase [Alloprevotella sp.]|nr:glycosyltransferase [Alloprevotella sp.]